MGEGQPNLRQLNRVRWAIYALVGLVVVLPYVLPAFQMKFKASDTSRKVYERMEDLKAGAHVLLAFDFDPASQAELEPMVRAVLKHCFSKGLIPVVMTHWSSGIDLDRRICEETAAECGELLHRPLESGKDWVFLGFRPGGAMLVVNMGENLKGAFDKDFYGQPTQSMDALQGVGSLKNMGMVVDFAAGATVNTWIAYGSDRFGFPLAAGTTAVSAPDLYPFYQSGQIVGFMGGLRGAADYELLAKVPGDATRGMFVQSATHLLLVVLILGANVRFLVGRFSSRRKG